MPTADEDALRAMRAASTALQELWAEPEGRAWARVTWSDDRVRELFLYACRLEVLPPQIGQLKALTKLTLGHGLMKELPPEIGQLKALTSLDLGHCLLKELPPEIWQLTALTDLNLTDCKLNVWQLPPQIEKLTALKELLLDGCNLKKLPPQIGQLTALTVLHLGRCLLKELPPEIGQLKALTDLSLFRCPLKELPPQIGQLKALTKLHLKACPLEELPPQVGQLTALTDLNLYECDQLTLAAGANAGQPAQAIVAAYAPLLIVEPHKDTPGELHAFLRANPLAVPAFFKYIVGDLTGDTHSNWLGEAIKATPELAHLTNPDGRWAGSVITAVAKQARLSRATARPDEDALQAMWAASPALQVWWPKGASPRWWRGVTWCDDRVQELDLDNSGLDVLAPQVGQLTALTSLKIKDCPLEELPPELGQLLALAVLDLYGCEQLKLAPGAKERRPVQDGIVAAYARLAIIEPRKDAPGELYAFLRAHPLWEPAFFKHIITNAAHANWLGKAVTATRELAKLTDDIGRRAIDAAHSVCKQAMQAALFLLGRYEVDDSKLLHRSATAAVAAADDHGDPEAKPVPRVALKAMREVEQVCAELKGRAGLDPQYVIAIKAVYADKKAVDADAWETVVSEAAGLEGVELKRVPGLSSSIKEHLFPSKKEMDHASDASKYKLLIVLELADRNLKHTIDHEHIAGEDWAAIRYVASHLGRALDHVHAEGGIHADLKPLNAVGDGNTWKLIDFDVFCKVGKPFGNKVPSSGYCPPEMAKVLLAATDQDTGEVDTSLLKEYVASEAYDLWSFGVVLYHLCFGTPLWKTNINDNVDLEGLRLLASVSESRLRKALKSALNNGFKKSASDELKAATNLLCKLLEPDPSERLAHFTRLSTPMEVVLQEPFFQGQSLDEAVLQQLVVQGQKILQQGEQILQNVSQMNAKIDQVLHQLSVQFEVLGTLLRGVEEIAPKLICFLPADTIGNDSRSWMSKIKSFHASDLFNKKVRIFFFDPWRLTLAPTNVTEDYPEGEGFELEFPRDWVVKAMPYVKLSLATLKVAYVAGRLAGFPVPDVQGVVGEWINGQAGELKKLAGEATNWLSQQTQDEKLAKKLLDTVDKNVQNVISREFDGIKPLDGDALGDALKEPLKKSFDELDTLLGPKYGTNGAWKKKCGLVLAMSRADGTSAYVLEADKAAYEERGAKLFASDPPPLPPARTAQGEASAACCPL